MNKLKTFLKRYRQQIAIDLFAITYFLTIYLYKQSYWELNVSTMIAESLDLLIYLIGIGIILFVLKVNFRRYFFTDLRTKGLKAVLIDLLQIPLFLFNALLIFILLFQTFFFVMNTMNYLQYGYWSTFFSNYSYDECDEIISQNAKIQAKLCTKNFQETYTLFAIIIHENTPIFRKVVYLGSYYDNGEGYEASWMDNDTFRVEIHTYNDVIKDIDPYSLFTN